MPVMYSIVVVASMIPFTLLLAFLVVYYAGLLGLSISGFGDALRKSGDTKDFYFPIIGILVGGFLLVILAKTLFTFRTPGGIRIIPGMLPEIESLVEECAYDAHVDSPEAIFIIPQVNAAAYSSGLPVLGGAPHNYVLIGAPLLVHLRRADLKAVLYHEFSHIILRRNSWSVSLNNKVEDFLGRFQAAQFSGGGLAIFVTFIPLIVVRLFHSARRRVMVQLSRKEELKVDSIASTFMGTENFRRSLVRAITTIGTLTIKGDGVVPLNDHINAEFHRSLLASAELGSSRKIPVTNYFDLARTVPGKAEPSWEARRAAAFEFLMNNKTDWTDTHPSLSDRILNLKGRPDHEWPFYSGDDPDLLGIGAAQEAWLSAALAENLRPVFFASTKVAGVGTLEGFRPDASIDFVCKREGCPRQGLSELSLSDNGISAFEGSNCRIVRWADVKKVEIFAGSTFNILETIIGSFAATLREAPTNRCLRLHLSDGTYLEITHWHFMQDVQEVEVIVSDLWKLKHTSGSALPKPDSPSASAPNAGRRSVGDSRAIRRGFERIVGFAIKAACAVGGYLAVQLLFLLIVLRNGNSGIPWSTPVTILALSGAALGWRWGNRLAVKLADRRRTHQHEP